MPTITIALPAYVTELQAEPFPASATAEVAQTVTLTGGAGSIVVAATGGAWCWRFTECGPGYRKTRFCAVSGSVNYSALVEMDPGTLIAALIPASQAWEATASAAAAAVAAKVGRGDLVFNIRDYGAVCNWTSGTSGTDDTAAINACLAAAGAAGSAECPARVLVPWTSSNGVKFAAAIVTPQFVEWDMRADLVYCGAGGEDALTIGASSPTRRQWHRIRLRKNTQSTWVSESDRGLVIKNHLHSTFDIVRADFFTVGMTCIGDGQGFGYNHVFVNSLTDNKIALDLTNDNGGWCNENDFYGGRFACSTSTNTSLDRVGVRVTSRAASKYYNNGNIFHAPAFELKGQAIAGSSRCALIEYGTAHIFQHCRHESNSPEVLEWQNNSHSNEMSFAYSDLGAARPVFVNNSTSSAGRVRLQYEMMVSTSQRTIHRANAVHRSACYYDGNSSVNLPGLTVGTSATGNTDARAQTLFTIATDYVEFPTSRYAGFYMSTRNLKRFTVFRDCETGYGGRLILRCYDSSGTILSAAGTVLTTTPAAAPTYATTFGGAWRTGGDSNAPLDIQVSAATDYVFIGVTGGTANCRLRGLSVATCDLEDASTWLAFPDMGRNYGTQAPTAGTWAVGREVWNAEPANGQPSAWVCTVAGSPGTWITR